MKLERFVPYNTQSINEDDKKGVLEVLDSLFLTQGNKIKEFEDALKEYVNAKFAITFNSATSALFATFNIIKQKYENMENINIITSPITFVATTNMMLANGIKPKFCDVNFDGNINVEKIEALIDKNTVAICSVDYSGKSVDVKKIQNFAKKNNLLWISDSSHSLGGSFEDQKIGSLADINIFSFHAIKSITTGEGGAIITNNEEFNELALLLRSHGVIKNHDCNHECKYLGFNFRMNELSCAMGLSQLKRLNSFIERRNEIANFYDEIFRNNPFFFIPKIESNKISSRHLYYILLDRKFHCNKEKIINELLDFNVGVQVHYKPIYNFLLYKKFNFEILNNAEEFYRSTLSIPLHLQIDNKLAKKIADILLFVLEKY